ncbi:hypothetical protein V492_06714 [Pseudogymnoascus sp. VKM F-4246]|nr:hypothetical protein V492_06714 [Pseudogymnoascus sp. VKM F-4246]
MEKSFQFVDGANIDNVARKSIRSHVMKGKNARRIVHRQSRLSLTTSWLPSGHKAAQRTQASRKDGDSIGMAIRVSRNLGSPFLTLRFPIELTPHSTQVFDQFFTHIVERLYPVHFGFSLDEAKMHWLGIVLSDEGATHCSIALMEACNGLFLGGNLNSSETLHHVSQTFVIIRKRLETDEALSDTTIGMVLMLILQEQVRNEDRAAEVHYEGLRKMVELRGGLGQLEQNPLLLLKICKVDIRYALQSGQPMLFFRDSFSTVQTTLESKGFARNRALDIPPTQCEQLNPYLRDILLDTLDATAVLNDFVGDGHLGLVTFQEILVSICSRLIHFRPLKSDKPLSPVEAAYHTGLIIFIIILFLQHDSRRIMDYNHVTARLKEALDSVHELGDGLAIWLMCLGGIWLGDEPDRLWISSMIGRFTCKTGIDSWPEVHQRVSKLPWVNAVHEVRGRLAWTSALEMSKGSSAH